MPVDSANVGVAFGLVIAAGAATALGAAVVFFPKLVKLASRRVLAASLGISAGVMLYVSFVEILRKAELSFIDAGHSEENAFIFSTLCFFGGVITMLVRPPYLFKNRRYASASWQIYHLVLPAFPPLVLLLSD